MDFLEAAGLCCTFRSKIVLLWPFKATSCGLYSIYEKSKANAVVKSYTLRTRSISYVDR